MGRILARDCGFKMIYQFLFSKEVDCENIIEEYSLVDDDKDYALKIYNNAKNNFDKIENKISMSLKNNLKITDLYKLDLAILVCAVTEIDFLNEKAPIVINEAVELAKKYSTDNSPKFVNGFLSSIYKQN